MTKQTAVQTAQLHATGGVISMPPVLRFESSASEREVISAFDRIYKVYSNDLGAFFRDLRDRKDRQAKLPFQEAA